MNNNINFFQFLITWLLIFFIWNSIRYSNGECVGVITKFSKSDKNFNSYDGELKTVPNYKTIDFSIMDNYRIECITPIDSINLYARLRIPVVVEYQKTRFSNYSFNTIYFVKSIKRVK